MRLKIVDNFIHQWLGLAYSKPANRVAGEVHADEPLRAFLPQVSVNTTLNDAEQFGDRYRISCLSPMPFAAFGPDQRPAHGFFGSKVIGRVSQAVVKDHHDVGSKSRLDIDRRF